MANELIDAYTARRLLKDFALEGELKGEELDWALKIIHQIPGYEKISFSKAARDKILNDVLILISNRGDEIPGSTPQEIENMIASAQSRQKVLEESKATGEKKTEEFIEAAKKVTAAKTTKEAPKIPLVEEKIKEEGLFRISPDTFQELTSRGIHTPFQIISFLAPPKKITESPETAVALSQAISLNQLEKKIGTLTPQQKELINLFRQAEFSFYAQTRLQRTIIPIEQITVLIQHVPQSQVSLFISPSEQGPSFVGGLAADIAGDVAQKAISKAATKVVTKALVDAGIMAAGTAVFPGVGTAIALVVDQVVGKLIDKAKDFLSWINKNFSKILVYLGIGSVIIGYLIGGVVGQLFMGVGLAAGVGGAVRLAGGPGAALSGAGNSISSFLSSLATTTIGVLALPFVITIMAIPAIVAIILFIINSGAYIVPPKIGVGAHYGPHDCSIETKIVERADAINKNLLLGFNNYYNKSPDYPELWNAELFATNPNPENQNTVIGIEDMFWCNYMPLKSYLAINLDLPLSLTAMMNYFISQQKWNSGEAATTKDICPGDAIFFKSPPDALLLSHVAVVESVTEDEIITVQSNSRWKKMTYFTDSSGHFPIYGTGNATIKIVGFGSP
jgi:hypothetical protein